MNRSPTDRRFEGRVAIVTGSSRGLGLATATRLAVEGASVVLNARRDDELALAAQSLREQGDDDVTTVAANVADSDTPQRLVDAAVDAFGGLDFVVNNVGISPYYGPLMDIDEARFTKTMATNTWPAVALVQAAMAAGLDRRHGAVVNVSTIGSRQPSPVLGAYTASKAALEVLTRAMAREVGTRGVRVNAVAPGLVRTEMTKVLVESGKGDAEAELLPLGRLGLPEDIAAAVCFLLSDDAAWITGVTLDVDGGRLLVGGEPRHLIGNFADEA